MKIILILLVFLVGTTLYGHNGNYGTIFLKHWEIPKENTSIEGIFSMYKNGEVYIETENNLVVHYPLSSFKSEDQQYVKSRYARIEKLNNYQLKPEIQPTEHLPYNEYTIGLLFVGLLALGWNMYSAINSKKFRYVMPILAVGMAFSLFGFTSITTRRLQQTITDPLAIDSAFIPFRPDVHTRWDANYFYVESKGIPDHEMMRGITGWQQQFPIPQCYIGTNAWSIPLNPEIAATPIPVNPQHFLRGAIAVAVNGVAIFNPYTNTGIDALVDGQLDIFGGHCGRADDYHYHIAPLQLYSKTSETLPIAYGLDGFAVYGAKEPDGSTMSTLDANHGHYGINGVYHYHGTIAAPYMIGSMVGKVTEDNTMQIIPQASAKPIRPAGNPLKGAVITKCIPNGKNNGYTLTYTLNGQTYSVEYSWDATGKYTFNYINPSGTTTETFNGFTQCVVPPSAVNETLLAESIVEFYPNPSKGIFRIQLQNEYQEQEVRAIDVYSTKGERVYHATSFTSVINGSSLAKGSYIITIHFPSYQVTKKIIIQ